MGKYADLYAKFGRDINSDAEKNKETTQEKPAAKTSRGKYSDLYAKFGRDLGGRRTKAAQEEAQQKVEEKNDALRNAQANYRRQYLINEAAKRENEKEAEAEERRSRRFANVAAAKAYTDTASSERSYEDRVKAAEVERIQAENRIRARSSDGQEAQRDDEARYNYIARRIDTQEKAKKVEEAPGAGKLTAEQLKEESAIGGVTKGDLAWYKEEKARRDEAAAQKKAAEEYFESLKTYYNNLTLDLDAAKAEYDRVAGIKRLLDNAGTELDRLKAENPRLWNEIDGIAQFLYGGPKAKQYGEGKMVDDGPDADYFGDNDDIARQHAYTRYILRQYGYKDYDTLAKEVAEKGNTWATARDIQESYKLATDARKDPEFEAWVGKGEKSTYKSLAGHNVRLSDVERLAKSGAMSDISDDYGPYAVMTDDELAVYDYYAGKEKAGEIPKGTADKYFGYIEDQLNQRWAAAKAGAIQNSFLGKAGQMFLTGHDQFVSGVYKKIGPKQEYYYPTVSQYTSAILTQDMGGFEKFWYDLGVNVSNMAPSIIAGKLASYINPVFGELVGAATMGVSASGNAYAEAINSGMTANQASAYSNLIGLSETTLQAIMGGIPYAGGVVSGRIFTKAGTRVLRFAGGLNSGMAKVAKVAGYGLKYFGGSFGEFVEEGLQEVLQPYFVSFVTGEAPDDVDWGSVFYNAGMGFVTSLLLGGADTAGKRLDARSRANDVINRGGVDFVVGLGLQFDEKSDVYRIAQEIRSEGYSAGNVAELLTAIEAETQSDPDYMQRFKDRDFGELNIKAKNETKTIDKNAKKIGKYVEKQDATEGAAYEAATQTPISENVAGQDVRGEEVSPARTAEEFVSRYNGEVAENATTEARPDTNAVDEGAARTSGTNVNTAAETNAPTVANVPAETVPSDNENVITVKRARASDASKAVSRITKNGKAIEGGGRYYVYDTAGTTAIRYDDAPANVSFTNEEGLAGRIDRVLSTEGNETGVVFDAGKISDLKTAIAAVKRIKGAYGDKGAAVAYNFGDGVVVDAAKVLDVAEALPGATVQRVPVGNGFYGLKFVSDVGTGLVMPMNAKTESAEDSVFLLGSKAAPKSAAVRLGNNTWAPAEGEAAIPSKNNDRVFNDDLTFNLADDTANDTRNDTINKNGAESAEKSSVSDNTAREGRRTTADNTEKGRNTTENTRESSENDGKVQKTAEKSAEKRTKGAENEKSGRRSSERTEEKSKNIPERGEKNAETTPQSLRDSSPYTGEPSEAAENERGSLGKLGMTDETASPREGSVKKRGGNNVFRTESGKYSGIDGINDDGDVVLDGGELLDVDSLAPEIRSAVDTVLADFYTGQITESEAAQMLRNGTLTYSKGEDSWIAEELNDGNTSEVMSAQQIERLVKKLFPGVNINYGRIQGKNTGGFMRRGEQGIRTRTVGMLPTVSHELTHIFDLTYRKNLHTLSGIDEVIKAAPKAWLNMYKKSKHATEATAWFGEQYFRSRKAAQQISPEFFRNFEAAFTETELKKLHELGDAINKFMAREFDENGNDITMLKQQRAQLTTKAAPKDMRSLKDKVKDFFRNKEAEFFNANSIFENKFGDDASVLYNANVISGAAKATHMITGTDGLVRKGRHSGGFDTSDGRHIDDLSTILSPLEKMMKSDKAAYDDFNVYLTLLRGGTKVTEGKRVFASDIANRPSEIRDSIKQLEKAHPEFREIADKAIEFHRELVKKMCVDTGLMSAEKFEQMTQEDPFYVPFRRDVDGSSGVPFTKGALKSEQRFKRMMGSGRDIYNPVESLFQDAYDTVISSLRAQYGDYILDKVDLAPAEWEWLATKVNAKVDVDVTDLTQQRDSFRGQLIASGMDQATVDAIMRIYDGTVGDEVKSFSVPYYQGEQFFLRRRWSVDPVTGAERSQLTCYQFNDPYAAETLKMAIDNSVNLSSKAMKGLLAISRFRKIFLTGSSPLFTVRNLIRDAQDAYAYGRINNPLTFLKEYAGALKSVIAADDAYMQYKEAGGGNSTRLSNDVRTVMDLVPAVYKAHTREATQFVRRVLRFVPDLIERANESIEQVPRMMAFKYALKQGLTEEQALYDAANITVNFGQHGSRKGAITTLGGIFPFFNAGLQGRYRMYQALKTDPATFLAKKTLTAIARVGILTALVKAFGAEDEYKKLSNYIKNNYYVIPIGGSSFIRLPKDREGGILDSLMENAVSSLMYGTDGEQWYDYATYLIEQIGGPFTLESFIGYSLEAVHDEGTLGDVLAGVGSDTVLSPIFDIIRNEDYRGVKIETSSDKKKVKSERYDENTSAIGKLLGKTGLFSPKQWDHFFTSLGFIPSAVLALPENFAEGGVFGPIKDVGEKFKSAFTSSAAYSNDAINDFYDGFEKLEMKKNSYNTGEVMKEYYRASGIKQIMSELYSMRRAAENEEEREAITRIIRDTAYDYVNDGGSEYKKGDYIRDALAELYDRLGSKDYNDIFWTAPKATIRAGGVEYKLDMMTYLDYADDYEKAMRIAYAAVVFDSYDSDDELAEAVRDAKKEAETAVKYRYMLKATPSGQQITTDYIKAQISNGAVDDGTLKKYVAQEKKAGREDKGIRTTLKNIYEAGYKTAKASGNDGLAERIEDVLVGLDVGFTVQTIRKWAD